MMTISSKPDGSFPKQVPCKFKLDKTKATFKIRKFLQSKETSFVFFYQLEVLERW